jgi:RHS repeat-associated protein
MLKFDRYDFKGNLLEKTRQVVNDAAILDVFNRPSPAFSIDAFRVDWTNVNDAVLDRKAYSSTISYDALNRAKKIIYPEDVENKRRQIIPHYNRAGVLDRVKLDDEIFVEHIDYNAKGQRVMIAYGNGIMTRYAYDPHSFRLLHLRTERYNKISDVQYRPAGSILQDFAYEFDLVGNILQLHDRTPGCGIINTPLGADALDRSFTYDALYRLRSATGRECDQTLNFPWNDSPRCTDQIKTTSYIEQYVYDLAGNIEQLKHLSNASGFTRDLKMVPGSNRLRDMTVGENIFDYAYDTNGNMIRETASRHFEWDHADRMQVYRTQTDASEPTVHAHYLYDASGQRVKKLVKKQGGKVEVTVYIDGVFEYQRIIQNGVTEENNTLHIMDNQGRIALVRVGIPFINDTTPAVKYQLGDHLGSSNVVVDGSGIFVNSEEYTPYGETSFGGFARKRFRFTGKERDEESGLNYHSARYLASWLGRWVSCDPAGIIDGINLYKYSKCNPVCFADLNGEQSTPRPAAGVEAPPAQPPKPTISINKEKGDNARDALKAQVESKGHGLQKEVTTKGGKGGSRHDITPDPKAPQTIAKTLESKHIDLNKYRSESGKLDESRLRSVIKKDVEQVMKHQMALKRGIKADLPMRESLIYTVENAGTGEAIQVQDLFRSEGVSFDIKGGVLQEGPAGLSTASGRPLSPSSIEPKGGPGALEVVAGKLGSLVGVFFHSLAVKTLAEDFEMMDDPGSPALGPVGTKRTDSVGTVWIKITEKEWVTEDYLKKML